MKTAKKLIFTATYNEVDNIIVLVNGILKSSPESDILVVDDGSPDGTGHQINLLKKQFKNIYLVERGGKRGIGSAHSFAMIYAILNNYDYLVTLDADLSHDPIFIPKLLSELVQSDGESIDFVIGSRYILGGGCEYVGYRKLLSAGGNWLSRLMTGINLHEFTTSYRAIRVSSISDTNLSWVSNQGYSYFLEVIVKLHRSGKKLSELPIFFYNRSKGYSKIPKLEVFRAIRKLLLLSASLLFNTKENIQIKAYKGSCINCGNIYLYKTTKNSPKVVCVKYGCLICNCVF